MKCQRTKEKRKVKIKIREMCGGEKKGNKKKRKETCGRKKKKIREK